MLDYDRKMSSLKGHEIQTIIDEKLDSVIHKELKKLYSEKMVNGRGSASMYNQILVRSRLEGCCFCSHGSSEELDHFLPKAKFPEFSVANP